MNIYNPLKTYPFSANRLMIVDWASLAYHQMHSLKSEKRTTELNLETSEDEIAVWNNHMLNKMLKYIKLFNPKDIVCALEGKNVWRFDYVREYYGDNTLVYFDSSAYYVRFDNCLYKVFKDDNEYKFHPMDIISDSNIYSLKYRKLNELPEATQNIIWSLYLPNGTPMLPKYKGTRGDEWEFKTPKSIWKEHKENFAVELGKLYRAKCIRVEGAEGDDVAYVASQYLKSKYDSIIVITKDSDFNQLLDDSKLKIYNHYNDIKNNDKAVEAVLNKKIDSLDNLKYRYKAVLEIPSIKLKRGILDIDNKYNKAKYNIELIKEKDDIIVLASHNGNNYNSYFGNLKNISLGDTINYYYDGKIYKYIYTDSYDIKKDGYADIYRKKGNKCIVLVTCKDGRNDGQTVFIGYLDEILEY